MADPAAANTSFRFCGIQLERAGVEDVSLKDARFAEGAKVH